ncbi:MAG: hypothetical protein ACI9I0_002430, partial [Rhodoferax sp.]
GHFSAQASNKAVESAPPLNATASGKAGEKAAIAVCSVVVTRYLALALVSVKRP